MGACLKRLIRMAAILILCCAVICCDKEEDEGKGSIYGVVSDYATGAPLSNANVQLRHSGETALIETALTGYDGHYSFLNVPSGNYTIKVTKDGYKDLVDEDEIKVTSGKRTQRDVHIEKLPLALRVVDSDGNDISSLDFGAEPDVTSRTFSIFNDSPQLLMWWVEENCNWITEVKSMMTNNQSGQIGAGKQEPIKVTINRNLLEPGLKTYILNINSDNGSKELLVTAGEAAGLPTLTTQQVSNVTSNSVIFNGTIVNEGLPAYTERGFVYANTAQPTIANGHKITSAVNSQATFSASVSGLNPDLTYYVRAYAINDVGPAYGNDVVFSTSGIPTEVTTSAVSNIGNNSAKFNGTINVVGSPAFSEKGFCYSKMGEPSISNNKVIVYGSGTGPYSYSVSDLEYQTTYYVKAYAIQNGQPIYGNKVQFTTSWSAVQVGTSAATSVESTSATLNGMIYNAGSPAYTERGFCYSAVSSMPTTSHNKIVVNGTGVTGDFNKNVTGLNEGTVYYVRAYAIQNGEVVYGESISFTTNEQPVVFTNDVSGLTVSEWPYSWSATFNGYVYSTGTPAYVERGFCYSYIYYEPIYALSDKVVVPGNGTGAFFKTVSDLMNNEFYYVRAYVKTASGQYIYGQTVSFSTYR